MSVCVWHKCLKWDFFVVCINACRYSVALYLLFFNMQSSCQTSLDWEASNYSDRTREILICLPDLVHRHSHGSALLIDHQEANNMGYLHAAWDKALFQWSGCIRIWTWLAWRVRLQNQDRTVIRTGMSLKKNQKKKNLRCQHPMPHDTMWCKSSLCSWYWTKDIKWQKKKSGCIT